MPVVITYDGTTPTVDADEDTWGDILNDDALAPIKVDLDALASQGNTNETNIATLTTNLGKAIYPGFVTIYAGSTAPTGWLICDGSAVSRTTYAALFAACGTFYGAGNGSTTFNIPDLRGEFVRGWDGTRGIDPDRVFGSSQADALKAHVHSVTPPASDGTGGSGLTATGTGGTETITPYNTASTGDTETRPRNVAMLYIIRTGL